MFADMGVSISDIDSDCPVLFVQCIGHNPGSGYLICQDARFKSMYWQPRRLDWNIHNTQHNTGIINK